MTKKFNPLHFTAKAIDEDYKAKVKKMSLTQAIQFLEKELKYDEHTGWSIRYYGFGEHFTFWMGDGSFLDFNMDGDTKITWEKLKEIIIESAMARKEFKDKLSKMLSLDEDILR
jgi:hypothetical protein